MLKNCTPMQSFGLSLYLYIVKTMRHLLLLAFLGCATAVSAGETYAVIISGGRSKMFNHERYWNDCAFLYRTLRQECRLSKDHITLLMADGDNPDNDMLRNGAVGFASSSTDLDGDGEPDLTLSATRRNVEDTFRQLSEKITAHDHLFIFITDHGECDGDGDVHLWLWGGERVSPQELAAIINQCRPKTMNILLGQCYAGAFVTPLQGDGRIITAACAADQMSWACKERCYDEFVYHWTCAIAQHDEQGQPVIATPHSDHRSENADTNGDGRVSMQEAFDYARQNDRRPETPGIFSQPAALAAQWSFGRLTDGIMATPHSDHRSENGQSVALHSDAIYDLQGKKH